jgi:hypothetical protein
MGRSGFDRVAIVGVYIAATVLAAQTALSSAPSVRLRFPMLNITEGFWGYVPAILICVSSAMWLLERLMPRAMSPAEYKSTAELTKTLVDASNALVASRPKLPDPTAPKAYVPESFARRYLDAINQRRTDLQIDALLRPHLNHWMRLEGRLERINKHSDGIAVMLSDPDQEHSREFWARFHLSWSVHLANVDAGEVIKVAVQIVDTGYGIELMNAELL